MTKVERERSMVEHLAGVMGLEITNWEMILGSDDRGVVNSHYRALGYKVGKRCLCFNPLEGPNAGNDAMALWGRAAGLGIGLTLSCTPTSQIWTATVCTGGSWDNPPTCVTQADSGPRAIAEAVALATGWKEPHA